MGLLDKVGKRVRIAEDGFGVKATISQRTLANAECLDDIAKLWIVRKPEARDIFSLNFRDQVEFIKNVQSIRKGVRKIFGIDRGTKIHRKSQNQTNRPSSSRWLDLRDQNMVSTVQQAECLQKLELSLCMEAACSLTCRSTRWIDQARVMQPDIWEEWWRSACVLDMQPDMWSTGYRCTCIWSHAKRHTGCHQPEADWLLSSINSPRPQIISSHPYLSVEVLLDTPPKSPKNCSKAKGGFVRVQISLSRRVSFFMMKPRFCPSPDQSSPVQSSGPLGYGQVFSDQPAAYRQRTLRPGLTE
ncbi:hypothetical protein F2Q70_00017627 [Brassica cretica]|uniref:Uncharacterized protein n=1 Tax=Brassica cretica TaxID=69181 RepID=A0A8S9I3R5_BRACR|nr:hypothetical protein F2Q70_00017627 [Brassica cretica]